MTQFTVLAQLGTTGKNHPNIIFIMADDMGYGDIQSFNKDSKILTPALNRLAAEGIKFTDAHAAGSWCVPSRYGFITGQYPMRKSMDIKKGGLVAPDRLTIASLLQRNGYYTALIGKWHLGFDGVNDWNKVNYTQPFNGGPVDRGFNYFFGMHASLDIPPYFFIENKRALVAPVDSITDNQSKNATSTISGAFWRGGKIAAGFKHDEILHTFTERAISFMQSRVQKNQQQPFFLYFALTAPHTPWVAEKQFKGKSKVGEYGDYVMQVDYTVGEILKSLEKLGLKENTLVIFSSDNGPVWFTKDIQQYAHSAAGPYRGMKLDAYEGAHRVPFIARWPGKIKANSNSLQLVCFTDMLATFADLTGDTLSVKNALDSYSILPALIHKKACERKGLIIEGHTVRQGDWKLIFGNGTGVLTKKYGFVMAQSVKGELYNLKTDPSEHTNLYTSRLDKVAELTKLMKQYKGDEATCTPAVLHK